MPKRPPLKPSARLVAARALAGAAEHFADLGPAAIDTVGLDAREARLAVAIHRTVLQRWLTLEHLLDEHLRQPMRALEPALRGVLLSAAAQLVFMQRLPAHAVVDESVKLARRLVRPGAAGLVNAVLRRVAVLVDGAVLDQPWSAAPDRLPLEYGYVALRRAVLPDPADLGRHLSLATSAPVVLVERWRRCFGDAVAIDLCLNAIANPPTIVAVEPGFAPGAGAAGGGASAVPHEREGFVVWDGAVDELRAFLADHPARRVQDPASAMAVAATRDLVLHTVIDYCAGRGTKTGQLAALHPGARIWATDPHPQRFAELSAAFADHPAVTVVAADRLREQFLGSGGGGSAGADLVLLDVPCTNTGVLARRPEARYRYSAASLASLVALQRKIIGQAMPLVTTGGYLLCTTCSLESAENQEQCRTLVERYAGKQRVENLTLPGGHGPTYHDGSYHALVQVDRPAG